MKHEGLNRLIENLKNLKPYLESRLDGQINNSLESMAQMERERLNEGLSTNGNLLRRNEGFYPYSPQYTKYKRSRGGQVNVVDLKLEGDYHRGITASKTGRMKVTLYSRDKKDRFLPEQYDGIHGLSDKNKRQIRQDFAPSIVLAVKQKITSK